MVLFCWYYHRGQTINFCLNHELFLRHTFNFFVIYQLHPNYHLAFFNFKELYGGRAFLKTMAEACKQLDAVLTGDALCRGKLSLYGRLLNICTKIKLSRNCTSTKGHTLAAFIKAFTFYFILLAWNLSRLKLINHFWCNSADLIVSEKNWSILKLSITFGVRLHRMHYTKNLLVHWKIHRPTKNNIFIFK